MSSRKDDVSIFDFNSLGAYLTSVFQQRKVARRYFSLRSWALKLGQKPSYSGNLSRILSGQRDLPKYMVASFVENLALDSNERAYFELLSIGNQKISVESLAKIRAALKAEETAVPLSKN